MEQLFNYTKNEELMKELVQLADRIEGWQYTKRGVERSSGALLEACQKVLPQREAELEQLIASVHRKLNQNVNANMLNLFRPSEGGDTNG